MLEQLRIKFLQIQNIRKFDTLNKFVYKSSLKILKMMIKDERIFTAVNIYKNLYEYFIFFFYIEPKRFIKLLPFITYRSHNKIFEDIFFEVSPFHDVAPSFFLYKPHVGKLIRKDGHTNDRNTIVSCLLCAQQATVSNEQFEAFVS